MRGCGSNTLPWGVGMSYDLHHMEGASLASLAELVTAFCRCTDGCGSSLRFFTQRP